MSATLKVTRLIGKTEEVEVTTADGKYRLSGKLDSNSSGASAFNGGNVVHKEDGVEVAFIDSWTRHGGLIVRFGAGQDVLEVSAVIKELADAFTAGADEQPAAEEGGAA